MPSSTAPPAEGTLHTFAPSLVAFEHQPHQPPPPPTHHPQNALLFLDGLYGSLLNVTYPRLLSTRLPATWSVLEILLPSSGPTGWCTGSLSTDAAALAKAVAYIRGSARFEGGKVVLMGHSTGCQTATEYVVGPWKADVEGRKGVDQKRPGVDGVVLQAGVSDAEALEAELGEESVARIDGFARGWVAEGRGEDVLPRALFARFDGGGVFGDQVPCARRWVSLASVDGQGDDDYFSSDAGEDKVRRIWGSGGFGGRGVPVMPLLGAQDQSVPDHVDKEALVKRWTTAVKNAGGQVGNGSGVIPGASHNLNDSSEEARDDLCNRVVDFLQMVASKST